VPHRRKPRESASGSHTLIDVLKSSVSAQVFAAISCILSKVSILAIFDFSVSKNTDLVPPLVRC
jgi:hypothetical protein